MSLCSKDAPTARSRSAASGWTCFDVEALIGRCEGVSSVAAARVDRAGHSSLAAFFVPLPDFEPGEVAAASATA
ncbi:hypothetical protein [Streptomyces sp. Inha503]|uniref:hypothetical protein n=1 Tax=Streptomyces sp. Inha503 TaxID=3383314 RepID=UPI00399FEBD1